MVSRSAAPAFRQRFDELCRRAGWQPRVVQESERVGAVVTMVAAEQGISLLAEAVSRQAHPGVTFRSVGGLQPMLEHNFAYRPGDESKAVDDFLKLLCKRAS